MHKVCAVNIALPCTESNKQSIIYKISEVECPALGTHLAIHLPQVAVGYLS